MAGEEHALRTPANDSLREFRNNLYLLPMAATSAVLFAQDAYDAFVQGHYGLGIFRITAGLSMGLLACTAGRDLDRTFQSQSG
jgi:hypothetical protein